MTIHPENTTITFSVLTTDTSGNLVPFTSGPYGTPVYFQAHVNWSSGYGAPTGNVNFWDNGGAGISGAQVDKTGTALSLPNSQIASGMHSITAGYYGDNSFNTSSNLTPIGFTITHVATNTALVAQQSAQSLLLTATVSATGSGSAPTGLIAFNNGSTVLGTAYLGNGTTSAGTTQATATFDGTQLAAGQYSVTASYPGDTNYTASNSTVVGLNLVADFNISNRGITSQTVAAGQVASYVNDIAITPFFGFSAPVTLSCSTPAQATTCAVNPTSVTTASGPNIASVTVNTTLRSLAPPSSPVERFYPRPQYVPLVPGTLLLVVLLLRFARTRRQALVGALPFAVLALFVVLQAMGCGGGSSTPPPPPPPPTGTPAGIYTVTVTGTSGSTTHTTTLTLTVN